MEDILIPLGVNAVISMLRAGKTKSKWRAAMLKVFVEIGKAFRSDEDFKMAAKSIGA